MTSLGDYDEKSFRISLNEGYSMKIEIRLGRATQTQLKLGKSNLTKYGEIFEE